MMNKKQARDIALKIKAKTGMTFLAMAQDLNKRVNTSYTEQSASNWFNKIKKNSESLEDEQPPVAIKVYLSLMRDIHLR